MSSPSSPGRKRLLRLGQSFSWAARGIWRCLWRERNLRVHLCAAGLALWLGAMLRLGRGEMALLLLCCGLVLTSELQNSALEAVTDFFAPDYSPLAGLVKDIAAGGVLCAAAFSAAAGAFLLWRPRELLGLWRWLWDSPGRAAALGLMLALGLVFVFAPGDKELVQKGAGAPKNDCEEP